jgi:hypothetical protein
VGAAMIDVDGVDDDAELRLGGGVALALEWLMFSRMH